jgi:circadian clock protein KaiB
VSEETHLHLRLYIAGDAPNSLQARANLEAVCREYLPKEAKIEIVDILQHPERALADGVLLTPMLVKLAPAPTRRVIGNLSQRQAVLNALGFSLSNT